MTSDQLLTHLIVKILELVLGVEMNMYGSVMV
jgi:hypothetical protein